MQEALGNRIDQALRRRLEHLAEEFADPDERLNARAELILLLYSYEVYELITNDPGDSGMGRPSTPRNMGGHGALTGGGRVPRDILCD
jgi:hypothetical protein